MKILILAFWVVVVVMSSGSALADPWQPASPTRKAVAPISPWLYIRDTCSSIPPKTLGRSE
jgi:hypothetical protein